MARESSTILRSNAQGGALPPLTSVSVLGPLRGARFDETRTPFPPRLTTRMDTTRYYLSPEMHVCTADGQVVILDLRGDKYLSLDEGASEVLSAHIGVLSSHEGLPQNDLAPEVGEVLFRLAGNGILSTVTPSRITAHDCRPLLAPTSAIVPRPPFREHVSTHHAARYIASVISAKLALRARTLYGVVIHERRRVIARSPADRVFDPVLAAPLCSIYSRLRIIATGPGQCLFDALALKLFLAKYGLFPQWIFGVRVHPFAAHCWLQHGDTVVNDSLDFVRRFTPIMAA